MKKQEQIQKLEKARKARERTTTGITMIALTMISTLIVDDRQNPYLAKGTMTSDIPRATSASMNLNARTFGYLDQADGIIRPVEQTAIVSPANLEDLIAIAPERHVGHSSKLSYSQREANKFLGMRCSFSDAV